MCHVNEGIEISKWLQGIQSYGYKLQAISYSSVGKESACKAGGPSAVPGLGNLLEKGEACTPVFLGFPCGSVGKESTCKAGDLGLIPGLGRSPGEGMLAWSIPWTVHGVTRN